jgi:hypothetical protein
MNERKARSDLKERDLRRTVEANYYVSSNQTNDGFLGVGSYIMQLAVQCDDLYTFHPLESTTYSLLVRRPGHEI